MITHQEKENDTFKSGQATVARYSFDPNLPHGPNTDGVDLPYHTNTDGYTVPDTTYKDPKNRRIRVVTIGAGFSGILLAYRIRNELENVEVNNNTQHLLRLNLGLPSLLKIDWCSISSTKRMERSVERGFVNPSPDFPRASYKTNAQ